MRYTFIIQNTSAITMVILNNEIITVMQEYIFGRMFVIKSIIESEQCHLKFTSVTKP